MNPTIDVVIPTWKPDAQFREVLLKLIRQTRPPRQILLINTEKELFDESLLEGLGDVRAAGEPCQTDSELQKTGPVIRVMHIRKMDFDHGGTRHMAAEMLDGDGILFMTQDAMPENSRLIECLLRPFEDPQVCVSYARQLPRQDCSLLERFTRNFNYPPQSRIKTAADLNVLGIKTAFCSNVCAMYRRSAYEEFGGFERHTIFNEDMIFAGRLIQGGKAVAYCADAEVIHSHNYSGTAQFHRNFDLGVSQAEHPELFSIASSESEGVRLIRKTAEYLVKKGKPWLLFPLIWQSGCKYLGYRLGKNYRRLPAGMVRACSLNKDYWNHGTGI
ncbi:MAG: glycosyltransferase [Lachnospiraceae bacterium]|nr:glycosyltransferase [Lachnospiraceae bacterium]